MTYRSGTTRALLTALLMAAPGVARAQNAALVGDVNLDGAVGALDAQMVLSRVVGLRLPAGAFPAPWGDANCDATLRALDAAVILAHTVALPTPGMCVGEPRARVRAVSVTPPVPAVAVGDSVQLTATPRDSAGSALGDRPVEWFSADTTVAVVSASGMVTARAAGPVAIHAVAEGAGVSALINGPSNPPAHILVLGGEDQSTDPHTILQRPVAVRVLDRGNNPLAGVEVLFAPHSAFDAVSVLDGVVMTDANGDAAVSWTVEEFGTHTLGVMVDGLEPVTLTAHVGRPIAATTACAIDASGVAWCWGDNSHGQVGDGTNAVRDVPTAVAGINEGDPSLVFSSIAEDTPGDHACGLASGFAYCWGANPYGQLGDGTTTSRNRPTAVAGGLTFTDIDVGVYHTCAITDAGAAYCWGWNASGQLGDGTTDDRSTPTPVAGGQTFSDIAVGLAHSCGITTGGQTLCWGSNGAGALGTGDFARREQPAPVYGAPAFVSIGAGAFATCALTADGTPFCWGGNANGQVGDGTTGNRTVPTAVSTGVKFTSLKPQYFATCGLATDQSIHCWGAASYIADGVTGVGPRLTPVQLAGGNVYASLHASLVHTCARSSAGAPFGQPYCWGANAPVAFGDGSRSGTFHRLPVAVQWPHATAGVAAQIQIVPGSVSALAGAPLAIAPGVIVRDAAGAPVVGAQVTFALASVGGALVDSVQVTDDTGFARLGGWTLAGTPGANLVTVSVTGAPSATYNVVGYATPASLTMELGDSIMIVPAFATVRPHAAVVRDASSNPIAGVPVTFTALDGGSIRVFNASTGGFDTFTTRTVNTTASGRAFVSWALGSDVQQRLAVEAAGFADTVVAPIPLPFTTSAHHCGIGTGGNAYCWGQNDGGQLGNVEAGSSSAVPVLVDASGVPFASVSSATPGAFSCAIASANGAAYCWGSNDFGQLGDGTQVGRGNAAAVSTAETFAQIETGHSFACGRRSDGAVFCWGSNYYGQLGKGTFGGVSTTPVPVNAPAPFETMSAGPLHVCGIVATGAAYCWGLNVFGQLGNGQNSDSHTPVRVAVNVVFQSVAAGDGFTCALDATGQAWCWGQGSGGQLGTGDPTNRNLPDRVQHGALRFTSIVSGGNFACGMTAAGGAHCWGRNDVGQLGDGTTTQRLTPSPVSGGLAFTTLMAAGTSACGVTAANQPYCWGGGGGGQLGNGSTSNALTPVAVLWPEGSPNIPASMVVAQGDNQGTVVATAVEVRPAVIVRNHTGAPIAGVSVEFSVASGGGGLTDPVVFTDSAGVATVGSWTLGPTAGTNTVVARVSGVPPITFSAHGIEPAASSRFCPGAVNSYSSLGAAANGTFADGVISVCDGTHDVTAVILGNKSLTIRAEGTGAILQAVGTAPTMTISNGATPTSAAVRLVGLIFQGQGDLLSINGQYGTVTVDSNAFFSTTGNGVGLGSTVGNGITIRGNTFTGGGSGVAGQNVDSLEVFANTFDGQANAAISIDWPGSGRKILYALGNTITNCGSFTCVFTHNFDTFVFEDNVISTPAERFAAEGVHLSGPSGVATVRRNTVSGIGVPADRNSTEGYPIRRAFNLSRVGSATLDSNTITNVWQGFLFDSVNASASNNVISVVNNAAGGAAGPNSVVMNRNDVTDFIQTLEGGNGATPFAVADFRCNWWGTTDGPGSANGWTVDAYTPYAAQAIAGNPGVSCDASAAAIAVTPAEEALTFTSTVAAPAPGTQPLGIRNVSTTMSLSDIAFGPITYGVDEPTGWLSLGTMPTTLGPGASGSITVDAARGVLPPGTFTATFPVTSSTAANSPRVITVTFVAEDTTSPMQILFETNRDSVGASPGSGNFELYLMDEDGANPVRLTNHSSSDVEASWSPDGSKITWVSSRNGGDNVFSMNADGTGVTQLTSGNGRNPSWSPDGTKIAFNNTLGEIWVMNADGTNQVLLAARPTGTTFNEKPRWSPDGSRISFHTDRDGNFEIYVMNADGTNHVRLTTDAGMDVDAAWAPDGSKLAFMSNRSGSSQVWVMNADGTGQAQLTSGSFFAAKPAWSRDGLRIAFGAGRADGGTDVNVMNADGSNRVAITNLGALYNYTPTWRP